jgi:DNA-binding NtrC family response regulator
MPFSIFYVDDETELLEMFVELFSTKEIEITTFSNPALVVQKARLTPPDLIFLDFRLKDTTGDAIASQLDPKIPKALITGDLSVSLVNTYEAVFEKPYKIEEVAAFIRGFTL